MDTTKLNQNTLRTSKTQKEYMSFLQANYDGKCIFCARDLLVKEYKYWILVKNRFPYDRVYEKHCMLATKRHVEELYELTHDEHMELDTLFDEIEHNQVILNRRANRSIPRHFHVHLVTIKQ